MHVPVAEEYPHLDPSIFSNPRTRIRQRIETFPETVASIKATFELIKKGNTEGPHRCFLTCQIKDVLQYGVFVGESTTKVTP